MLVHHRKVTSTHSDSYKLLKQDFLGQPALKDSVAYKNAYCKTKYILYITWDKQWVRFHIMGDVGDGFATKYCRV